MGNIGFKLRLFAYIGFEQIGIDKMGINVI